MATPPLPQGLILVSPAFLSGLAAPVGDQTALPRQWHSVPGRRSGTMAHPYAGAASPTRAWPPAPFRRWKTRRRQKGILTGRWTFA